MPSALPEGDPAPPDGRLPEAVVAQVGRRPFGIYLHVPFCTTRCGYCDFNTYTATELGTDPGASRVGYVAGPSVSSTSPSGALGADAPPVSTVFVGGGTPTLLPPADLAPLPRGRGRTVRPGRRRRGDHGVQPGLHRRRPGWRRCARRGSRGSRSGCSRPCRTCSPPSNRVHTPGRAQQAVADAWAAGFDHVSLDLIYGTPGESGPTGRPASPRPSRPGPTTSARTP